MIIDNLLEIVDDRIIHRNKTIKRFYITMKLLRVSEGDDAEENARDEFVGDMDFDLNPRWDYSKFVRITKPLQEGRRYQMDYSSVMKLGGIWYFTVGYNIHRNINLARPIRKRCIILGCSKLEYNNGFCYLHDEKWNKSWKYNSEKVDKINKYRIKSEKKYEQKKMGYIREDRIRIAKIECFLDHVKNDENLSSPKCKFINWSKIRKISLSTFLDGSKLVAAPIKFKNKINWANTDKIYILKDKGKSSPFNDIIV